MTAHVGTAGDAGREITVEVNGTVERLKVTAHHTLLSVLRDQLALFGVRDGCGVGMCGACTVLVDGKAVSSCLVLAPMADGASVVTVEGLEDDEGELDAVQKAFIQHSAFQCSYCTPGFVLLTKYLLDEDQLPTRAELREALAGNLCRCGCYGNIAAAALSVRDEREEAT